MQWWQDSKVAAHVSEALVHFGQAELRRADESTTYVCDLYFRGFNKLWNALALHEDEPARADTTAFITLVSVIPPDGKAQVLKSPATAALADLVPEILDHYVLKSRGHLSGQAMSAPLKNEATARHRKFRTAHAEHSSAESPTTSRVALKRLAELLFVVRSNIAHGEKAPYGPDLEKARRDEEVSALVVPVLRLLVELLLPGASISRAD
jgi:hypothetical protein